MSANLTGSGECRRCDGTGMAPLVYGDDGSPEDYFPCPACDLGDPEASA